MEIFAKIFYSIFFMSIGYIILRYRKTVKSWTGNFVWAEQHIGRGGTYFIIILIGMCCIFYGATYPFGGSEIITGK